MASKFIGKCEWQPKSPHCNPLDYHFWNALKVEVYKGRSDIMELISFLLFVETDFRIERL